jgi:hypothetical protein
MPKKIWYWNLIRLLLLSHGYGEEEYNGKCPYSEKDMNLWFQRGGVRILGLISMMTRRDP